MPSMGFDKDILRVLNEHGVTPLIRTTQVSDSAVISMVEHGLGVSVLSRLVLRGRQNSVRALPLEPWVSPPVRRRSCAPSPASSSAKPAR